MHPQDAPERTGKAGPGKRPAGIAALGRAGLLVTVAGFVVNVLAYVVPVLGARRLDAADLGALAALLAIGAIVTVPGVGLQLAVAVQRARAAGRAAPAVGTVSLVTAVASGGALLLAAPFAAAALRLPFGQLALLAALTVAVVLAGRYLGELQGDQRFGRLAAAMTLLGVTRYGGIVAGLAAGAGVTVSLAVAAAVAWLTLPLIVWLAAGAAPSGGAAAALSTRQLGRRVAGACGATLAMLAVSYVDLILARQLLPAAEAGAYAVGSVLTKGALWAPQVITVLALPRFAKGDAGSIRVATGAVALCGAVLVTATALAGDLAMRLAGGAGYTGLGAQAPLFAASGALYSLTFVLVNALIAAGARWPSAPLWAATALFAGGAQLLPHPTVGTLIGLAVATAAATLLATAVAYRAAKRRPRSTEVNGY